MEKNKKKKRRLADARKRAQDDSLGFQRTAYNVPDGVKMFQVKSDDTRRISIVPFVLTKDNPYGNEGDLYYEATFWTHRGIGVTESAYCCPVGMEEGPCPVCEHRADLAKDPKTSKSVLTSLKMKKRNLLLVFDHEAPEDGLQMWDVSSFLFLDKVHTKIKKSDADDNYETFFDPGKGGLMIRCGFEEKSFDGRKFYACEDIEFKPRKKDQQIPEEIFEQAEEIDLSSLFIVEDYETLHDIYYQVGKGKKDDKKKKKKFKKDNDLDDDDDDLDDDLDDDDDDDGIDDDDDLDDDLDDDDDDDEPPKKKKDKKKDKKKKKDKDKKSKKGKGKKKKKDKDEAPF